MNAARFFARQGGFDHDLCDRQHVLQFPALRSFKLSSQDVVAPTVDRRQRFCKSFLVPPHAGTTPHQAFQRVADIDQIQTITTVGNGRIDDLDTLETVGNFARRGASSAPGVRSVDHAFQ